MNAEFFALAVVAAQILHRDAAGPAR